MTEDAKLAKVAEFAFAAARAAADELGIDPSIVIAIGSPDTAALAWWGKAPDPERDAMGVAATATKHLYDLTSHVDAAAEQARTS